VVMAFASRVKTSVPAVILGLVADC